MNFTNNNLDFVHDDHDLTRTHDENTIGHNTTVNDFWVMITRMRSIPKPEAICIEEMACN